MAKYSLIFLFAVFSLVKLEQSKKNVLLLVADDFRNQLGTYVKTPNIDALASKSLVFDRAYCQVALCSPSRTSFLTGRRPDTNHVWRISPDEYWRTVTNATTIPQYFKENGYVSAGMGKIFHPGRASGFDDTKYSWSLPYFHATDDVQSLDSWHCFENISDSALQDGKIADNAIETLKQIKQNRSMGNDQPFFLAVGFHKPHLPFFAPSKYCDMYSDVKLPVNPHAPANMPAIAWTTSEELKMYADMKKYDLPECISDADAAMTGKDCMLSDTDTLQLRRSYYAAISFTDSQVGRVVNELLNQGLANNTVIVFMGDHGWKLGEHNMWTKNTNLEADTRVPFMLSVPGLTDKGMHTEALVELVDLFPTLAEVAGLTVPPLCAKDNRDVLACVEGSSVAPLLSNPDQTWKKGAFSQFPRPASGLSSIPNMPAFNNRVDRGESVMGYAVRADQYRFVEWYRFDRNTGVPNWKEVWGTELYNHTHPVIYFNDENVNQADNINMEGIVTELRATLQAGWRALLQPKN